MTKSIFDIPEKQSNWDSASIIQFESQLAKYFRGRGDQISLDCLKMRLCNHIARYDQFILDNKTEEILRTKEIALYGAGTFGEDMANILSSDGINIVAIIDRVKQGKLAGYPLYDYETFRVNYPNAYIVITSTAYYTDIFSYLKSSKDNMVIWNSEHIYQKYLSVPVEWTRLCFLSGNQYFPKELPFPGENEVFIDCGVFNGNDTIKFMNWCGGKGKAYGFEPDPENYKQALKIYNSLRNVRLFNAGVSDSAGKLRFFSMMGEGSSINNTGNIEIDVVCIDDILKGERATFIKMDIEGAELDALHGAELTIRKYKPKLAISIYHKPEDIYEIPAYILQLNPDYVLYIRHHSASLYDTVLYAW